MPERIVIEEEKKAELRQQHVARYEFAATYAKGKTVLDVACGSGYGSAILMNAGATRVTGMDRAHEAIEYARQHYSTAGLEFIEADLETIDKLPTSDLIVSFETIEHLRDPQRFLAKVGEALGPRGTFIVSTPVRESRVTDKPPSNPFHCHEWSVEEFSSLLSKYFSRLQFFYQFNFRKKWYPFSRTIARLRISFLDPDLVKEILAYRASQDPPPGADTALERQYIVGVCVGSV